MTLSSNWKVKFFTTSLIKSWSYQFLSLIDLKSIKFNQKLPQIASEDLTKKLPKIAFEDLTDASLKLLLKIRQKTA